MLKKTEKSPFKLEAAIFDMDGTLLNTEDIYYQADKNFLELFGIEYTSQTHEYMIGKGVKGFLDWTLEQKPDIPYSYQELAALKEKIFLDCAIDNAQVFDHMLPLLKAFAESGIPCAIASGSSLNVIEILTEKTGIRDYFSALVSSENVERPKPYPDVFLETAKRLGVSPSHCVVFEDSLPGVKAALDAGMMCIAIPTIKKEKYAPEFYDAHILFENGAEEFDYNIVLDWLGLSLCSAK
ncbi:HAD family phosphatase [Spirochaetia bacterium 38H-sp]|uniref:HAD family phosphatase n=1 Tax=Rarispira pelagica TaxID=3141764 RepID=A0ABU9UCL3_9SPIR